MAADHMTAREIAAQNRRLREARQAELDVEGKVAGGPFDTVTDLDAPPDETPPLADFGIDFELPASTNQNPDPASEAARAASPQAEIRARLDAATAPAAAEAARFAAGPLPRIVDGLIVPARSVADHPLATWVLIPVGEVAAIGVTKSAVGVTPKTGRWLAVWVGPIADRDAVLEQFAADYAAARRARR